MGWVVSLWWVGRVCRYYFGDGGETRCSAASERFAPCGCPLCRGRSSAVSGVACSAGYDSPAVPSCRLVDMTET